MSTYVLISRVLTYAGFMFNLLALWIPGWGSYCGTCTKPGPTDDDKVFTCQFFGLFDWCISQVGLQTCYGCK